MRYDRSLYTWLAPGPHSKYVNGFRHNRSSDPISGAWHLCGGYGPMQFVHMALFTWMEATIVRFQVRFERENDVANHLKALSRLAFIIGLV